MSGPGHHIAFKWEFSLGHIVQVLLVAAAGLGIWYGLVADVDTNRRNIAANAKHIEDLREANTKMLEQVEASAERREHRLMGHIGEIKQDVSWLVRREADRGAK